MRVGAMGGTGPYVLYLSPGLCIRRQPVDGQCMEIMVQDDGFKSDSLPLNIVFLYAYLSAVAYANANGKITLDFAQDALSGNNGVLVWYWATLAVLKVGRQIDQYLSSLGMSVASTASNLGNEALMAAGTMMAGLRTAGAGRQLVDKAARKAGYASAGGALRHGFRSMMGQPQKQQNFSAANKPTSADISRAVNNKGDALSGKGTDNKVGEMVIGGPGVNSEDRIMTADGRTLTEAGIILQMQRYPALRCLRTA